MTAGLTVAGRVLVGRETAEALWPDQSVWLDAVLEGREMLRRKARTFHLATRLLPQTIRDDIAILYAWCRIADDLGDEASDAVAGATALDQFTEELQGRAAPRPVVAALRLVARRHDLALIHAGELLDGVRSDLGEVRIADDIALRRYCYAVASTVGLMLSRILGVPAGPADAFAVDLGLAMQVTNIVRDVQEDAVRGRVYLPATRLAAHGLTPQQVLDGSADPEAVRQVSEELLAMADQYYASAAAGLCYIPWRARFGIAVAHRVYAAIGWRIRRLRHNPLDGRMIVPPAEKVARVAQALVTTLASLVTPGTHVAHNDDLHRGLPWHGAGVTHSNR